MADKHSNLFNRLAQSVRHHKIISIVVVVVVLAGLVTWRAEAAKSTKGGYLTRRVTTGDIASTVSANATVQATQEVVLSFKNSGYVQNVSVTQGQFVKAGTVLAQEQASDYQAQLDQADANLAKVPDEIDQAKASLTQAQNNLDLAKTTLAQDEALFAAGAISKSTLQSTQNSYQNDLVAEQSAQSNVNMAVNTDALTAQAGVTLAQNNLTGCEIVSTMDGYVVNINGNTGEWTQGGAPASSASSSSTSSSQFTISVSSNQLELLAEINEADIAKVSTGNKVTFTVDAFPNQTFTGQITSLAAEATAVQGVQYYQAYVSIDNQTGLKAGMPAAINIIFAQKSNVVVVPRAALDYAAGLAKGGGSHVAVLSDGKPQLVPVQTGIQNNSLVEITSGLTAGQQVILSGQGLTRSSSTSQDQGQGPSTTGRAMHIIGG
ncbi:MAG TPA: efflux RND transporter periplasmic adaptor subunit [Spirochaetia bacterium]|nr:efflux RND transporter periplasmic adaptor subunit [Spirochaetia bacterium]